MADIRKFMNILNESFSNPMMETSSDMETLLIKLANQYIGNDPKLRYRGGTDFVYPKKNISCSMAFCPFGKYVVSYGSTSQEKETSQEEAQEYVRKSIQIYRSDWEAFGIYEGDGSLTDPSMAFAIIGRKANFADDPERAAEDFINHYFNSKEYLKSGIDTSNTKALYAHVKSEFISQFAEDSDVDMETAKSLADKAFASGSVKKEFKSDYKFHIQQD